MHEIKKQTQQGNIKNVQCQLSFSVTPKPITEFDFFTS